MTDRDRDPSPSGTERETQIVSYRVDASDRIARVNDAFRRFAIENGAPALAWPGLVGRPLYSMFEGMPTREIYRALLERARDKGVGAQFEFRCDAPDQRRLLEMDLRPAPDERGSIDFFVRTLSVEARPRVALLDPNAPRYDRLVRLCAWCKRVHDPSHGWFEIEEAIGRMNLFVEGRVPGITHGICGDCSRSFDSLLG